MQKQPLRVWLYARTADARPGVLEEQLNSLYREAERRGYTVVNGGAEHRCAGDLDRPALFAMLAAVRGGRVDAVMLTRLSRFSYHRLALYLILCFLQDHGVGLITTEYELRYILYLRGFERTLLDRAQENGCNALWKYPPAQNKSLYYRNKEECAMETLSVLPDGRIALCKMVHGTEITLVFQAKECPETLNKVTSQIMAAYAERKEKYGKTSKSGRK